MNPEFTVEFYNLSTDKKPVFTRTFSKKHEKIAPIKGLFEKICFFNGESGFELKFVGGINLLFKQWGGKIRLKESRMK